MRYIDADKLIAHLKDEIKGCEIPFGSRANGKGIAYGTALGLKSAMSFAETLTTADVVPKSEVDEIMGKYDDLKLKCVDLQKDKAELIAWANDKKNEVAREIFEEIKEEIEEALKSNYKVLPQLEVSNELYNRVQGKIDALRGIDGFVEELKNKYTKGE